MFSMTTTPKGNPMLKLILLKTTIHFSYKTLCLLKVFINIRNLPMKTAFKSKKQNVLLVHKMCSVFNIKGDNLKDGHITD